MTHPEPSGRDGFAVPVGREYTAIRVQEFAEQYPRVGRLLRWFDYTHLDPPFRAIWQMHHDLAYEMVRRHPDGGDLDQLLMGLRHLLAARDCFDRAMVAGQ